MLSLKAGMPSEATSMRGEPSTYARQMRCADRAAWGYGYIRNWDLNVLTSSARTDHTAISRRRFAATSGGDTEPISRFLKLKADGLSNTLRAGTDSARGAFTSPRPIHYEYARCITVREMARLHGFPDWFRLHSTKWHGARQVGDANCAAACSSHRISRGLCVEREAYAAEEGSGSRRPGAVGNGYEQSGRVARSSNPPSAAEK